MPDLDALLSPRSIAIIGASPDHTVIRGKVQHVLQHRNYPGAIYPISRSHAEVQGRKAYPNLAALPAAPDLAIIIIPAEHVADAVEDCGRAGVKAAYIISSGFAEEAGAAGAARQGRILDAARRHDMAVIGPNAEGFFNAAEDIVATFSPAVENFAQTMLPDTAKGKRISVLTQSGGVGFSYYHRGRPRQLRFAHVISTGNEACLDSFTLAEHLIDRDRTDIILAYVEGIKDVAAFRRAAAKAADRGVPIIIAKMGRSEAGARAAASHTAALAGADAAHDAIFRRYGVIRALDMDEMLDIAAGFAFCPPPAGRRIGIMSGSGGAGVWMSDMLALAGLEVPRLDDATRATCEALMPAYGSAANPVDLTAGAIGKVGYAHVVEILQGSPLLDAVVIVGSIASPKRLIEDKPKLAEVSQHPTKPVLFCAYTAAAQAAVDVAAEVGVPVFTAMPGCARALRAMADWREFREAWRRRAPDPAPAPKPAVTALLRHAGPVLSEHQSKAVLAAAGIFRADEVLASDAEEALAAARRIPGPIALKIQSPDIPHKTEIGGVALGLQDEAAVRAAFAAIIGRAQAAHPAARIEGVLVAPMAPPGVEMILGIQRDPQFGPMLMAGLGGIHVEVLRDVAFAPAPLDAADARALLGRLKAATLLEGVRGAPPADTAALVALMVTLSRFAADHAEEIAEIDLNPVLVHPQGLTVVDALIIRRERKD
jgi:acyl-CoA synthetase (NDP forming)